MTVTEIVGQVASLTWPMSWVGKNIVILVGLSIFSRWEHVEMFLGVTSAIPRAQVWRADPSAVVNSSRIDLENELGEQKWLVTSHLLLEASIENSHHTAIVMESQAYIRSLFPSSHSTPSGGFLQWPIDPTRAFNPQIFIWMTWVSSTNPPQKPKPKKPGRS